MQRSTSWSDCWEEKGKIKGLRKQLQMGLGLQNKDDEDQARLWSFVRDWLSKLYSHYRGAGFQVLTRRHLSLSFAFRQCFWSGVASKLRRRLRAHWNIINTPCHFIYCRFSMQTFLLFWLALLPPRGWSVWKISGLAVWCVASVIHFCRHYFLHSAESTDLSFQVIWQLLPWLILWLFWVLSVQNPQIFSFNITWDKEMN